MPAAFSSVNCRLMRTSHAQRSSSVKGTPDRIFSILDNGCRSSPSINRYPRISATALPTVVLPLPDTPIMMIDLPVMIPASKIRAIVQNRPRCSSCSSGSDPAFFLLRTLLHFLILDLFAGIQQVTYRDPNRTGRSLLIKIDPDTIIGC